METPIVLGAALFKPDSVRHIDRVIDYFGGAPAVAGRDDGDRESAGAAADLHAAASK